MPESVTQMLCNLLYAVISCAIAIGGAVLVRYINTRTNITFKDEITKAVETAVTYVSQTFVDKSKADGKFDKFAQKEALQEAIKIATNQISNSAMSFLKKDKSTEQVTEYLVALIEEQVKVQKLKFSQLKGGETSGNSTTDN